MSDLQNPLFDKEKEFLERKKLEYERALRGDVDHIKDQSIMVGKVAAVGAGLAGGIWLIITILSSKKKKKKNPYVKANGDDFDNDFDYGFGQEGFDQQDGAQDDELGAQYYTAGNGKRYKSNVYRKSAAESAQVFGAHDQQDGREADDLGFGAKATHPADAGRSRAQDDYREPSLHDTGDFGDDPFQDLPYDDSRRLPTSHAFDKTGPGNGQSSSRSRIVAQVLQSFLKSDTGKVLVAQLAAVALAMVTKMVNEFFPSAKNPDSASDLATSPGYVPAETGFSPVASSASPDFPDASTYSQSI